MQNHSRQNPDSFTGTLNDDDFIVISRNGGEEKMNLSGPMDRIHDDILLLCFESVIQIWEHASGGGRDDPHAAVTISHVSRYWRQLALSTPSLWTHVCITPNKTSDVDFFRDFLSRSGSMDISVYFRHCDSSYMYNSLSAGFMDPDFPAVSYYSDDEDHESEPYDDYDYEPVIEALLTASHRIVVMSIQSSENIVRELLSHPSTTPSLSACSQLFRALTAITITNPLGAEPLDYDQFQALLKSSPNLRHLTVDVLAIASPYNLGISEIPTLEHLSFTCPLNDHWTFFAHLSVPNICQITLSNLRHIQPTDMRNVFLEKNGCARFPKVVALTLENFHSQRNDVAKLFPSAFPNITSLTIDVSSLASLAFGHYREDASGILEIISNASDKTWIMPTWPYMQHLTLDYRVIHWAPYLSVVYCWLEWRQSEAKCSLRIYIMGVTAARSKVGDAVFSTHLRKLQQYGKLENIDILDME
ncbi:hypothetical protein BJ138DRAFT_1099890 [Hygrophoropsis aurantiaca]|uniref:Uncharacterized protein n=1 Tax=Hygrophoropsis aurantiaca TaxID=72124 RepID=A0ACB8AHR0_9AGAM|nr:hypothetical protein BJ138DRAFT_1099890 [Hygrophoropsis aurantiaca]